MTAQEYDSRIARYRAEAKDAEERGDLLVYKAKTALYDKLLERRWVICEHPAEPPC